LKEKVESMKFGEEYCLLCFCNVESAAVYGSVNFSRTKLGMHLKTHGRLVWRNWMQRREKLAIIAKQAIISYFSFFP